MTPVTSGRLASRLLLSRLLALGGISSHATIIGRLFRLRLTLPVAIRLRLPLALVSLRVLSLRTLLLVSLLALLLLLLLLVIRLWMLLAIGLWLRLRLTLLLLLLLLLALVSCRWSPALLVLLPIVHGRLLLLLQVVRLLLADLNGRHGLCGLLLWGSHTLIALLATPTVVVLTAGI